MSSAKLLSIRIIDAWGFSETTSDPYVQVNANGCKVHKTKTLPKTIVPKWETIFVVTEPDILNIHLQFVIYNHHLFTKDEILGEAEIINPMVGGGEVRTIALQPAGSLRIQIVPGKVLDKSQRPVVILRCVTWNVDLSRPEATQLAACITPDSDIVVYGFQRGVVTKMEQAVREVSRCRV